MRVVIGGAHNGKREYVKRILKDEPNQWVDCSVGDLEIPTGCKVVVDRIEHWLARAELPEAEAVEFIMK
ncbi:MAG TPA: hypothetical protein VFX34_04615, partial [Sporosarcina sp.]|nr:hypothetical protein [Sporosarcina sp.]